jgi:hypothetical protein
MFSRDASRLIRIVRVVTGIAMLCFCFQAPGFGAARISGERDVGAGPATVPRTIYVSDFDLEAQDIQTETGPLESLRQQRGRTGGILPKPHATQKDPEARSRELVDLMATSLVSDLVRLGFDARRLGHPKPLPAEGLLVRGVFAHVDEGNRVRRAVIGFGAGETDLQVIVTVDDLVQGSPKPFYELDTSAESRKLPGAAITLNPYVAAAKFVVATKDPEKGVKETASKIADEIGRRLQQKGGRSN